MNYYTLDKDDDIIIDYVINSIIEEMCNKKEMHFQIKVMELCNDIDNKVKIQLNSFYKLNLIQKMIGTKFNNFIEKHLENIIDKIFFVLHKRYTINVINQTIYFEKNIELIKY
jgi:hypothetical protein